MRRLTVMVERIDSNVVTALWAEAILEAGNKKVGARATFFGANAYNTIVHGLMISLALSLSRLFDSGSKRRPPNRRDVASIPLIVRLLRQKRCQKRLIDEARRWTPQITELEEVQARACETAIGSAIEAYEKLVASVAGRAVIQRLREFRNKHLAHSLINDVIRAVPTYTDLFTLTDVARDVMEQAKFAIKGHNEDLKQAERIILAEGELFWDRALTAVIDR